jgi:hypothetical protein
MSEASESDQSPLLGARCGAELTPGKGNFYVVQIEALADPSPPQFSAEDREHDAWTEPGSIE